MPAPGRILRGSLSSVNGANASGKAIVSIVINQRVMPNHILKPVGVFSYTERFAIPIIVDQNDRINFQTTITTENATNNIVSLLIELDM